MGVSGESNSVKTSFVELPDELDRVFPLMKELRTALDIDEFKRLVMLAHTADGYRLVVLERGGKPVALLGYRILHDLVHGSHLYVDDLVTTKDQRSAGHGAELLRFAEAEARRLGLTGLRLCTGVENESAIRFYEREGWSARALAFKKKVPRH
ncbi:MAG TPA: GNAT family N-acetyltransferase [Bdellovibrionales bacterium]|nr:GNAT family N-acetyltransferase [Bdellovibrionales bacterium]